MNHGPLPLRLGALLCALVLAATALAAPPGRETRARERTTESAERREREARREGNLEALPREFRQSWLYQHEGRLAEGDKGEGSHTLRRHVPERTSEQAIRRVLEPREAMYEHNGAKNRPDLSVYKDLPHAERAIRSTLNSHENSIRIERWLRDPASGEVLSVNGQHAEPVGLVYERSSPSKPIDFSQPPRETNTNVVVLRRHGDGYFILTSYPTSRSTDARAPP